MKGAAVHFEKVQKRFGTVEALSDFDLQIKPGEFLTLLGPSGSGKTTALNVLAGFIDASGGEVLIGGKSVLGLPPEKRNVGMVFQSFSLFPHMNVFENVAFPLRLRKVSRAEITRRVGESLEMVRLQDYAKRMPKELSGGQRQRVAFARAVVFEPPVLLMDEPLGALDLKLREAMQLEVKRYHAQLGCTIIFVTHDQGEALVLSERIAVMDEGRIVQVDTPPNIYDHPNSKYVAEFIGKTNILKIEPVGPSEIRLKELGINLQLDKNMAHWSGHQNFLSVRPEKVQQGKAPDESSVSFKAVVDETLFLGDIIQYSVQLQTGDHLFFQEHRGPDIPILKPEQKVELCFLLSDAKLVANVDPTPVEQS
jgi:putative spermidine/putrescine transport system ATP-binding protein